jgi:hypothetical protein
MTDDDEKKPDQYLRAIDGGKVVKIDAKKKRRTLKDDLKAAMPVEPQSDGKAWPEILGRRADQTNYKGVLSGKWKASFTDDGALPRDCPFLCCGFDGDLHFIIDSDKQFRVIKTSDFGQKTTQSLSRAAPEFLYWAWPRPNKDGEIVGFRQEMATADIMQACSLRGVLDPKEAVRGCGAWRNEADGSLIVHCGGQLWEAGTLIDLGIVDGMIYPRRRTIMEPWRECLTGKEGPALDLLPLLKRWNWARPDLDPYLMLGWIGAAMICGALPWRPFVYLSGDKATGKSTLQKLIKGLFGSMLVQAANATAAGVYQLMQYDALPVAIDENEPSGEKTKALLELARTASDDQLMLRGGATHQGVQFKNHSSFLFTSINQPAFSDADKTRMALLTLRRVPDGTDRLVLPSSEEMTRMGQKIMRRMIDGWPRFMTTYEAVRDMLAGCGHSGRGQDTFGVLLTCASLLVEEDGEALDVALGINATDWNVWASLLDAKSLRENEDIGENFRNCLSHLLTVTVDVWRGGTRRNVGAVLEQFNSDNDLRKARELLTDIGITIGKPGKVQDVKDGKGFRDLQFAIANSHSGLAVLFRGSHWEGNWSAALQQAPQEKWYTKMVRFGAVSLRATCFPLGFVTQREADTVKTADDDDF